jgi:hypothetical protein
MADEPISLKGRLEVQEFEFNVVAATVLSYVRRRNWEYIKENHPDVFNFVKEQIESVDRGSRQ